MRLPWNLVFTVFDLFESRMLWVKKCHDTISLQCKRKFYHHGIFQISPPEHCDRGFHKKVPQEWTATKYNVCSKMWHAKGQNATKCDRMMSHSVIICLILSYFVTLCCVSLHYVKFCCCSLRGDLWNLEFGQILSTSSWRMKVLKIFEISENLLWNRWNFWANFWDQWKFSANFSDRWTFWANFWDQWKFWANFWDRSDFVDKFLDRWKFW